MVIVIIRIKLKYPTDERIENAEALFFEKRRLLCSTLFENLDKEISSIRNRYGRAQTITYVELLPFIKIKNELITKKHVDDPIVKEAKDFIENMIEKLSLDLSNELQQIIQQVQTKLSQGITSEDLSLY